MVLDKKNYIFNDMKGQTLVKNPGIIDGQSFVIMDLHDCDVYVLDHTAQIQVDDCKNCNIFLGPCKGSVFFRDCSDCTVHVAARQFRTRDVHNMKFAVYCPTQPSIETSTNCIFSCWRGAYPGLTEHLKAADLDPEVNTWRQIYDFNRADDLGAPHWIIEDPAPLDWVEVPLEGSDAPCDNPIVRADGALYSGAAAAGGGEMPQEEAGGMFGVFPAATEAAPLDEEVFFGAAPTSKVPMRAGLGDEEFDVGDGEEEGLPSVPPVSAPGTVEEPTALSKKMVEIRERMEVEAKEESDSRMSSQQEASAYLTTYYKARSDRLETHAKTVRQAEQDVLAPPSEDLSIWERMFLYIDASKTASTAGKDMSRYQQVLFAAKAKKIQTPTRPDWGGNK